MEIRYRPRFRREFKKLTLVLQKEAITRERIFRTNPFDVRLHTHKLHGPLSDFWALSIDNRFRIIFSFVEANIVEFYSEDTP